MSQSTEREFLFILTIGQVALGYSTEGAALGNEVQAKGSSHAVGHAWHNEQKRLTNVCSGTWLSICTSSSRGSMSKTMGRSLGHPPGGWNPAG